MQKLKRAMKCIPLLAAVLLLLAGSAKAQAAHQAVLTWVAATDATVSTTYNVYRASGSCPVSGLGTLTFVKVNAVALSALTYTDAGLAVGVYCYYVTQFQNASESIPSNTVGGPAKPNTVTVQIVIS